MGKTSGPAYVETDQVQEFASANDPVFRAKVAGDAFERIRVEADGTIVTGNGTATPATSVTDAGAVPKALYDANTVLAATTDDTPAAITMGASTILARLAAGNIKAASVAEMLTLLMGAPKSAYTQTYSTADKTHATPTAAAVATTASTDTTPFGYTTQAQADAIVTALNALRADHLDLAQLVNALIDDAQALGLVG